MKFQLSHTGSFRLSEYLHELPTHQLRFHPYQLLAAILCLFESKMVSLNTPVLYLRALCIFALRMLPSIGYHHIVMIVLTLAIISNGNVLK